MRERETGTTRKLCSCCYALLFPYLTVWTAERQARTARGGVDHPFNRLSPRRSPCCHDRRNVVGRHLELGQGPCRTLTPPHHLHESSPADRAGVRPRSC